MYTFPGGDLHNKRTFLVAPLSIPIYLWGCLIMEIGTVSFRGYENCMRPSKNHPGDPGRTAPRLPAHEAELLIAHPSCGLGQLELADSLRNSDERGIFI